MKVTNYISLFLIFMVVFIIIPQPVWSIDANKKMLSISVNGVVKDAQGNPIFKAKVYGNQGAVETETNEQGNFILQVSPQSFILIESEGYDSFTLKADDKNLNIVLIQSEFLFGSKDILRMAFKEVRKGLSVGNISRLNPTEILKQDNVTRFQNLIDTYGAGMKGGYNLLGLGDALVIVDGLPRDASMLQPEEIEDITILKDVNSALLYGSQAKNGVILVKTKRGASNKKIINMSFEQGMNTPIEIPKYLNSKDYMTLYNEAQTNDNPSKVPDYDPIEIAKYNGSNPYRYPDLNYYGQNYLRSFSNSTRFFGEFSGGNNVASYYTNIGWEHQDVLYRADNGQNNGTDRLRVRGNVDFKINEHIKSYIDAAFVFNTNTGLRTDYFMMASTYRPNDYAPILPVEAFEDPTITDPLNHVNQNYILGGSSLTLKNSYGKNLIGELGSAGYSRNYSSTMQFNTGVIFDLEQITRGLTLRGDVSFDTYGAYSEAVQNTYALYEPIWNDLSGKINAITTINNDSKTGVLTLSSGSLARTLGTNILLGYDRTFNKDHHIASSLLGYYSMATVENSLYSDKNAHLGLRVGYDYNKCYILDFSTAMINSVKLAPGNRLSFSPSMGLGWVLSNDGFWITNKIVDYLKIKATAGILQTDASSSFGYNRFKEIYNGGSNFGTGDAGGYSLQTTYVSQIANPNLGMEKMKNLNIGFEAALFSKSIFIDASYFVTHYTDQITQRFNYYPSLISSLIPYENYNETAYTGLDVSIKYQKKWNDFRFSTLLNVLYSNSEYLIRDEIHNNDYQYLVGQSSDTYWGLKSLGFFKTDEEALAANQRFGTVRRGDIHYADLNGDGFVDDNDKFAIGNASPRIIATLTLSIVYKGFSLFVDAATRLGYNWMMSSTESPNKYYWVDGTTKYSEIVLNRWTDATVATATYPRLTAQTSQNNFRTSDFWMRNGNDLNLRRIQLNYTLPQQLFKNLFIKGVSTYIRGNNLLMLSDNAQLRQTNTYISMRSFAVGLKLTY